jgi:hypothetical protein
MGRLTGKVRALVCCCCVNGGSQKGISFADRMGRRDDLGLPVGRSATELKLVEGPREHRVNREGHQAPVLYR